MVKINYEHTDAIHNTKDALEILPFLFKYIRPASIIDIGCGNGSWLKAAKTLGVHIVKGVDGIKVDKDQLLIDDDAFLLHDLTKPLQLNKTYDLAISLEVAEHLPETSADSFIDTLCNHSNVVLFSAAIPNQGGQFHINEQWPEYWHQKFKVRGYFAYDILRQEFWNNSNVFCWYSQNMILYAKPHIIDAKILPNDVVNGLIHPHIFKRKIDHPRYIKSINELLRLLLITCKVLVKRSLGKK